MCACVCYLLKRLTTVLIRCLPSCLSSFCLFPNTIRSPLDKTRCHTVPSTTLAPEHPVHVVDKHPESRLTPSPPRRTKDSGEDGVLRDNHVDKVSRGHTGPFTPESVGSRKRTGVSEHRVFSRRVLGTGYLPGRHALGRCTRETKPSIYDSDKVSTYDR